MSPEDEPDAVPAEPAAPEPDFMSLDEVPDVAPEPEAPVEVELPAPVPELVLGLAEDAPLFVSLLELFVSVLEPLPPDGLLVAPAPDDDPAAPLPEPLVAPPLWANAEVASMAPATVSAKALIHVFITVLLMLML